MLTPGSPEWIAVDKEVAARVSKAAVVATTTKLVKTAVSPVVPATVVNTKKGKANVVTSAA
jgi:hypothetical protein